MLFKKFTDFNNPNHENIEKFLQSKYKITLLKEIVKPEVDSLFI